MPTGEVSLVVLAVGAGSLFFSHVNDAGFWLVKEYFGMTVGQTIKTWSLMETVLSVTGLVSCCCSSLVDLEVVDVAAARHQVDVVVGADPGHAGHQPVEPVVELGVVAAAAVERVHVDHAGAREQLLDQRVDPARRPSVSSRVTMFWT